MCKGGGGMTAKERREAILSHLKESKAPACAAALAGLLGVSRQVIVGDVALLRAGGAQIVSTSRGYMISPEEGLVHQVVCHHTPQQTREELYTMVDCGCTVLDVTVEHPVYGEITAALQLACRYDVDEFVRKMQENAAQPLSLLTEGLHFHRLSVPDEAAFTRVCDALRHLGMLLED